MQSKRALLDRFFYSGYGASMLEKIEESVDEPRRCTWWVRRLIDSAEMIDATYLVHGLRVFAAAPTHSGVVGLRALLQEAEADMQPAGRRARSWPATPTMTARTVEAAEARARAANKPPFRRVTFAGVSSQRAAESGGRASPPPAEPDDLAAAYPRLPSVAELCRQAPKAKLSPPPPAAPVAEAPAASSPPPRRRQPPASPALPSAVRPRTGEPHAGVAVWRSPMEDEPMTSTPAAVDATPADASLPSFLPCDARPRRLPPPPRSTWAVPPPEPRRRGRAASHDLDLDLVPRKKIDSDLDLDLDLDLAAAALDAAAVAAAESGAKARWWHALRRPSCSGRRARRLLRLGRPGRHARRRVGRRLASAECNISARRGGLAL